MKGSPKVHRGAWARVAIAGLVSSGVQCHKAAAPPPESQTAPAEQSAPAEPKAAHEGVDPDHPPAYFEEVVSRARAASHTQGTPPHTVTLPPSLQNLDYEAYRTIRFRPEKSLWRGEPGHFEVQFFHLGLHYLEPLRISVLEDGKLSLLPFERDMFAYEGVAPPPADAKLGFAGFRVHAPLNRPDYRDEVLVFQGASYFRSLGRGEVYGLSGRALALDTGEPGPEEFPRFTEFTLVRPGPDDDFFWVLGFLESPRATGAYAFRVTPGENTVIDVHAHVFPRGPIKALGIAPLTSMFLFGEESPGRFGGDHPALKRPEAHDSDGLVAWSQSGEWLFRPLQNPPRTRVSTLRLDSPRGFGLVQRDRDPKSYNDPEYAYERRPSAFVEPIGDWGPGSIRLLEIATELESDDNMGAMWVPDHVPEAGLDLHYRLRFGQDPLEGKGPGARAIATRFERMSPKRTRFEIDFAGKTLGGKSGDKPIEAVIDVSHGKLVKERLTPDLAQERCRLVFEIETQTPGDVDLHAFLRAGDDVLTETWAYLLSKP